jgi:intracellular septation protein A
MLDFIILLFFVFLLNVYNFDIAMFWTMIVAAIAIAVEILLGRKLHPLQWLAYVTIFAFGIPSLLWQNPLIFQYKITILYLVFSLSLLLYPVFFSGSLLEIFFPEIFLKESYPWLSRWFSFIFFSGAIANNAAIKYLTLNQWSFFKIGLIVMITLLIGALMYQALLEKASHDEDKNPDKK